MDTQAGLIFKVFILSAVLSVFIKYGGMVLPIAPIQTNALIGILIPPLIVALALGWRARKQSKVICAPLPRRRSHSSDGV